MQNMDPVKGSKGKLPKNDAILLFTISMDLECQ